MAHETYVCWQSVDAQAILNSDAEHIAEEVFLAIHSEHPLWLKDPSDQTRHWRREAQEFLLDFLSPDHNHMQVAVTGNSGAGKSHLIHWMKLSIPSTGTHRLLTVPRSGTSLRGVLELIIGQLPTDQQSKYLEKIDQSGFQDETKRQRKRRLLSEIALAVEADKRQSASHDPQTEAWLIGRLPHLFRDPYLLKHYSSGNGDVFDLLVDHISETHNDYERIAEPRAFAREDLPLTGVAVQHLARDTRDFLTGVMGDDTLIQLCVDIVNRNLSTAVARTLNFSSDQLIQLMGDVRRQLKLEGLSLVVLIEDFAQCQGLDEALLMALINRSDDKNGLCDLRWAMAVTTGWYERMPDTVRTRMDFVIDVDPPDNQASTLTEQEIVEFSSRYLNATRVGVASLRGWNQNEPRQRVPNACESCYRQIPCHEAFGMVGDNVGLYPFTSQALLNMARQKKAIGERFNPRRLIKFVLAEVLDKHRKELIDGQFPSRRLRDKMVEQGSGLPAALRDRLRQVDQINFERQMNVLELWGQPDRVVDVPGRVFEEFGLPVPDVTTRPATPVDAAKFSGTESVTSLPPSGDQEDIVLRTLRSWANGGAMIEKVTTALRKLVFDAVYGGLNWDAEGLTRSAFVAQTGSAAPFAQRYIEFARQETQSVAAAHGVILRIPCAGGPDITTCSLALQGLYQFSRERDWKFPDGGQYLRAVSLCLQHWCNELIGQFRKLPDGKGEWDPIGSAIEILLTGVVLAGRVPLKEYDSIDLLRLSLEPLPDPSRLPTQSAETTRLYRSIFDAQDKLIKIIKQWGCGTKGGKAGTFVDTPRLLGPVKRMRDTWMPQLRPPESVEQRSDYRIIGTIHQQVRDGLPAIFLSEAERLRGWAERLSALNTKTLIPELTRFRQSITAGGIPVPDGSLQHLDAAIEMVRLSPLGPARSVAGKVARGEATIACVSNAGVQKALGALTQLAAAVDKVVGVVESRIAAESKRLDEEMDSDGELAACIPAELLRLEKAFLQLGATHV